MKDNSIPDRKETLQRVQSYLADKTKPSTPLPVDYLDELELIWGKKWGAQSEIGKLRETMVQRPGNEMAPPTEDLAWYQLTEQPNVAKCQEEHDGLVDIFKQEGVTVHDVSPPEDWLMTEPYGVPHARYGGGARDPGVVVNGGAIIGRMSLAYRKGEEAWWCRKAVDLGMPILFTVHGSGTFEGGNVVWLDSTHVSIGRSARTNSEGLEQVSMILRSVGVEEVIVVPIPGWLDNLEWPAGGYAHLDIVFGYVDDGLALVYPPGVPYDFIERLRSKDINLVEVWPEDARRLACNVVAIEPGKIVMVDGLDRATRDLEREGVDVIPLSWNETMKGGGGPHCATGPLRRDSGPRLG